MKKELFNHGWEFSLDNGEARPVKIPHDWLIGDAHNFYTSGVGKYTRSLDLRQIDDYTTGNGQRVSLRFGGVYMDSTLNVNGRFVGEWKYGYTTFEFDITDYLKDNGENEIELTVNYDGESARWYTGAGVYRDMWLIIRNKHHFAPDGIYIASKYSDGKWSWEAEAEVVADGCAFDVRHTLLDAHGQVVECSETGTAQAKELNAGKVETWDIDNPRLYTVRSELLVDGEVVDTVDTRIGFRTTDFCTDRGFFLNGRNLKIFGACQHHDLGSLGAAFHKDAAQRQLDILRKMGVNAIRTAHNPPAPGLIELCDEMGFLVMSELTDIWCRAKTPGDYSRFFDEWVERDAAAWIRRDRNHPCIIMWSVGNEIPDTHADADDGTKTLERLVNLVKLHDPKGNAQATLCSNYMTWENTQKCVENVEVIVGYNYNENLYQDHHAAHPGWVIYGSETSSTLQSRGVYHFPLSRAVLADDDLQCSTLGNTTTSWGAVNTQACIRDDFSAPFSLGQFIWSGIDYLGEPTPYHTKNSYFGQADTAGFEKDTYYIYKAAWTDYRKDPFVHVFPYWDFSPGQLIDVRVCSNAPNVALFLNDKMLGKACIDGKATISEYETNEHGYKSCAEQWIATWQVPYEEGVLRAEAYDEQNEQVAIMERSSFNDATELRTDTASYGNLDFITITAVDEKGRLVENANCRVDVSINDNDEKLKLLALDNGDSSDYESYHLSSRRLFGGKLLAIVENTGRCRSRAGDSNACCGSFDAIEFSISKDDIPIRKIELIRDGYEYKAKIFPSNATYSDLEWRLTDAGGIDSPMGELQISEDGLCATIIPKGDGKGYVRCSARNGKEHISLISTLEAEVMGMGQLFLNPYDFLSAGLYTASNCKLGSGNGRGVATRQLDISHVGFENIDFGTFGSDEITLWLFPMGGDPFDFEIYEGMPDDSGKLVYTARYDKGSIWNTYIEASYKLPRLLQGVTTLCFVFHDKVHFKGFQFRG